MIDKLTYDQVLAIAKELKDQAQIIEGLLENRSIQDLKDFSSTVEGYSKFLENAVELNKDADKALSSLMQK